MERKHEIRIHMGIAFILLLAAEFLLAMMIFRTCANANGLLLLTGKLCLPAQIYAAVRWLSPDKPRRGAALPGIIFLGALLFDLIYWLFMWNTVRPAYIVDIHRLADFSVLSIAASALSMLPCKLYENALAKEAQITEAMQEA